MAEPDKKKAEDSGDDAGLDALIQEAEAEVGVDDELDEMISTVEKQENTPPAPYVSPPTPEKERSFVDAFSEEFLGGAAQVANTLSFGGAKQIGALAAGALGDKPFHQGYEESLRNWEKRTAGVGAKAGEFVGETALAAAAAPIVGPLVAGVKGAKYAAPVIEELAAAGAPLVSRYVEGADRQLTGEKQENLSNVGLREFATSALLGGGVRAGVGLLGKAAKAGAKATKKWHASAPGKALAKQGYSTQNLKRLDNEGIDYVEHLNWIKDNIPDGAIDDQIEAAAKARRTATETLNSVTQQADDVAVPAPVLNRINETLSAKYGKTDAAGAIKKLGWGKNKQGGQYTIDQLYEAKAALRKKASSVNQKVVQEAYQDAADALDAVIEDLAPPQLTETLREADKVLTNATAAEDALMAQRYGTFRKAAPAKISKGGVFERTFHAGLQSADAALGSGSAVKMANFADAVLSGDPRLGKWGKALYKSMQKGPRAFNAAVYVLSKRDPSFRSVREQIEDEKRKTASQLQLDFITDTSR